MKFQLALAVAALFSFSEARWSYDSTSSSSSEPECHALQILKHGKCVCPSPLFEGPLKGDYNCYCGYQEFKSGVKEEVLAEPLPEGGYRCACYKDDHGRKTKWDEHKKECVPVKGEIKEHEKRYAPLFHKSKYLKHRY